MLTSNWFQGESKASERTFVVQRYWILNVYTFIKYIKQCVCIKWRTNICMGAYCYYYDYILASSAILLSLYFSLFHSIVCFIFTCMYYIYPCPSSYEYSPDCCMCWTWYVSSMVIVVCVAFVARLEWMLRNEYSSMLTVCIPYS